MTIEYTKKEIDFFDKQLEKDNKAIEKIQHAKSVREIARIEKAWRKEEEKERKRYSRENW
jgi:hypothetical protein